MKDRDNKVLLKLLHPSRDVKSGLKLKVCGMKYENNISELVKLSPDYIGFNFYTRSKRYVGRDFNAKTIKGVSDKIKRVGIFVNSTKQYIMNKVKEFRLDYIQLHGNESPDFCARLSKSVKIIKAFGISEYFDFNVLENYKPYCDYYLFDTKTSGYGGSGKTFNWNILKKYDNETPFFLSGGIDLKDIKKILNLKSRVHNLFALDVNSKFEVKPGLKDTDKLNKLKNEISG